MGYLFPCHWDYNLYAAISYEKVDAHSFMYTMILVGTVTMHTKARQAVMNVDTC